MKMNLLFSGKHSLVIIVLMGLSSIFLIISGYFVVVEFKHIASVNHRDFLIKLPFPSLVSSPISYEKEQYQALLEKIIAPASIKVLAEKDKLVVSSQSIDDEQLWRQMVASIISLDKNLHVVKMCGSITSGCAGSALAVEITGERQFFSIKESSK